MAFKEQYAIFAVPKGQLQGQLQAEIVHLGMKCHAPTFAPHTTVLAAIERPREEVLAVAAEMCKHVKKYRINFTEVACGSIYYQCVYLLVDKTEGVLAAGAAARKAFGITTGPYMPHLSLLYSDIPQEERAKIVEHEKERLYDNPATRLLETGFDVDSLAVWYVPEEDKSLAGWCQLAEFPLAD
ncbi:hypothetical protein CHLRE_10g419600v5 [Chlamydomonas reinhardtii]|uniref:Cyclic phosphodiesterase n=1 Tax=Chlamydomonas reinhardtii TaxID=3055 RepID=A8ICY4_CHLRE|nr:uncharacterized protein CHLRE_10g419600v5 [Chlamydomonas reinhardtii]PNW77036.1 hypothetical protein CHLRE_10g419600v5 [Chlamydomonas reinhardtii]|eukprot:XP_001702617.1 predicted protein [Chlamydomonas reinhardtii]